jgi:hypothetical protein
MPMTKTNTNNPIRGRVVPNASQRADCQAVIAQLTFADLGRGAGTLHTVGSARLDMQGNTGGSANLQVQIGTGTVAAGLVSNTLLETPDPLNQKGVAHAAISILNQSLDTGTVWQLAGKLP